MKSESLDWKTWALGILLTLIMSTSGIMCNTVTTRFEKVEAAQNATVTEARNAAIQAAVVQEVVRQLTLSLDKLDAKQTLLVDKMEALLVGMSKDSKRWNAEMDRLEKDRKK